MHDRSKSEHYCCHEEDGRRKMGHRGDGERLNSRHGHHQRRHRQHHSTSAVSSRRTKPGSESIPADRKKSSRKKRRALNKDLPPLPVEKEQQNFNVEPSSNSSCATILADKIPATMPPPFGVGYQLSHNPEPTPILQVC